LLRLYFGVPEDRKPLMGADFLPSLGTHRQS
jgi:hypothetical protein